MKTEARFSRGGRKKATQYCGLILLLLLVMLAWTSTSWASGVSHQIYTPQRISAQKVKAFLGSLSLGTASPLPGTDGVLLTGDSDTLAKAHTVLRIVDRSTTYTIKTIGSLAQVRDIPGNAVIAHEVGGVDVGTFASPPTGKNGRLALLDVLHGQIIVIAPESKMRKIMDVIEGRVAPRPLEAPLATATHHNPAPQAYHETLTPARLAAAQENSSASGRLIDGAAAAQREKLPQGGSSKSQTVELGHAPVPADHQQTYESPEVKNGQEELLLDLPEQIDLIRLLSLAGEYLDLNFVYEADKLQGKANISLMLKGDQRGKVKISELYPLLESVLRYMNFAMTRKGNLVQVVPMDEVMKIDPQIKTEGGLVEHGDAVITRIIRLEHISPDNAEKLLNNMALAEKVVGIEETKTLIVTAFAFRMPRIETFLELADTPGRPKRFRYRQLQYTMAKSLKEKVKALAEQLGSVEVSISQAAPTLERRRGESDASYAARQRAAERAREAAAARAPKKTSDDAVYLDADERTNRILMIGREDQLDVVDDLIDSLDVEKQEVRILKPYRVENLEAAEVREKLAELGIVSSNLSYGSSQQRLTGENRTGTSANQPTRTSTTSTTTRETSSRDGIQDEPQVVVIEATNSLLVNATPEQHLQIAEILSHLDRQTEETAIPYRIYPLENQEPEELAQVLEKLILETVQDKEGKTETKVPKLDEEIVIVPDPKSFSLIVYANNKNQEWIKSLVTELDRARPQVLIDVTLVEISKNDDFQYDLNVLGGIPDLAATGLTNTGFDTQSILDSLMNNDRNRIIGLQSNGGSGQGFYGDKHINALMTAMQSKGYGRVLAKPKILVNDNEEGLIKTEDKVYVKTTGSTISGETGLSQQTESWEEYPTGITLTITPHINEGDLLRLSVELNRTDVDESKSVQDAPPATNASDVATTVTVPDKSTIILGGLLRLNQNKGGSKVPILGDLPLIGGLFRSVNNTDSSKHMYVFVKAEVIRPQEVLEGTSDLDRISELHRSAFQEHEAEFQMYESWPGIKAQPMGPKKVLDAR